MKARRKEHEELRYCTYISYGFEKEEIDLAGVGHSLGSHNVSFITDIICSSAIIISRELSSRDVDFHFRYHTLSVVVLPPGRYK